MKITKEILLNNLTFGYYSFHKNIKEFDRLSSICHLHESQIHKNFDDLSNLSVMKFEDMISDFHIDYSGKYTHYFSDIHNIDILQRKKDFMEREFMELPYFINLNRKKNLKELNV